MRAVILAAGIASRLRPLTNDTPKCLLPIGGTTILAHTIENLLTNAITDILIVTGYRAEQIHDYMKLRFPDLGIAFVHNEVYATTNNIYSLWLTREHIRGNDMLLLDSDIIFDPRILRMLLASGHRDCLAMRSEGGVGNEEIKVRVDSSSRILEINKEVPVSEAHGESIGIERFSRNWVDSLCPVLDRKMLVDREVNQFYEKAFEEMIETGHDLYAIDIGALKCMEIDTAEDFLRAEREVLPHMQGLSP